MSGRKKGLNIDEKRKRILSIFTESCDVYQLKDLEKLAPEKGVVVQSVKDVVTALVDDGLVESEKIGGQVFFWSFPSKRIMAKKRHLAECKRKLAKLREKKVKLKENLEAAKTAAVPDPERDAMVKKLAEAVGSKNRAAEELASLKENSSAVCQETEKAMTVAQDSANRWTDNVFTIRSWLVEKFNAESKMLDKRFGIPEDFDYVD